MLAKWEPANYWGYDMKIHKRLNDTTTVCGRTITPTTELDSRNYTCESCSKPRPAQSTTTKLTPCFPTHVPEERTVYIKSVAYHAPGDERPHVIFKTKNGRVGELEDIGNISTRHLKVGSRIRIMAIWAGRGQLLWIGCAGPFPESPERS